MAGLCKKNPENMKQITFEVDVRKNDKKNLLTDDCPQRPTSLRFKKKEVSEILLRVIRDEVRV